MAQKQDAGQIFALDIGTRSIIGIVGHAEEGRFHVEAVEKEEHGRRAMLDGQIVEIQQVAEVAKVVVKRLEAKTHCRLRRVCVAAAGRALRSQGAGFSLEFPELQVADADLLGQLEAGAVSAAESELAAGNESGDRYYMVGYTARQYRLDGYTMSNLMGHRGRKFEVDVVSTFLPSGVVESLYAVVSRLGLEVSSLTLEPIASLNAAIPEDIRLLNLVLADIGAGTSDLAVCREGSVVGYTMATIAGDEITEALMKDLLVDFKTAERLKLQIGSREPQPYSDVLGLKHEADPQELWELAQPAARRLAKEIATKALEINGGTPSAVFLAGGGSKLRGLPQLVAEELEMSEGRVALAGRHFEASAWSDEYDLNDPEFATPLGIAVSAALGMINDSYMITLNDSPAKLFRSGVLTLRDVLLMNGYHYADMMGHTGANLTVTINGERKFFPGTPGTPAQMLRNGEEATLSEVVQAGDRVDFTPAVAGAPAVCTLGELLGEAVTGSTVNGRTESPEYVLRQGDAVETLPGAKLPARSRRTQRLQATAPAESAATSAPAVEESHRAEPAGEKTEKSLPILPTRPAAPTGAAARATARTTTIPGETVQITPPAVQAESSEAQVERESEKISAPPVAPVEAPVKAVEPAESRQAPVKPRRRERPVSSAEPPRREELAGQMEFTGGGPSVLQIQMNGSLLRLPPKPQGGEYYLMDVLQYSGLDFDNLNRPVELLINGQPGQFMQVLQSMDDVVIRYQE